MLTLRDFDYTLPSERIAQTPSHPRDHSKLMVVSRKTGTIAHKHFYDLPDLLDANDVLVTNNTKTLPMRTFGRKLTGGKIEVLFHKRLELFPDHEVWEVLTSPGLPVGQTVVFDQTSMQLTCLEDLGYTRKVRAEGWDQSVIETLYHIGELPTPHYIRKHLENPQDYQTIYAKLEGSSATPTAGLHFTPNVFAALAQKHIPVVELTLHVGLGTFLPVKEEQIEKHVMHCEWFTLSREVALQLNAYKDAGRRIVAVGTTTTRVLETCAKNRRLVAQTGETRLFVYPPYEFQFVDAMLTNFHLPKSTLLMLVSALASQGKKFQNFQTSLAGIAYEEAIKQNYRFFSFGDAMLIE